MFRRRALALVVLAMAGAAHAATHQKIPDPATPWAAIAVVAIVIIVAPLLYFLPGIIAFRRHHHNAVAILVFNLLLGWTFLGWVIALVWALTAVRRLEWQRIEPDIL
jgi:T4 superinfection immunity protein